MKQRNWLPLQLFAACLVGLLLGKFCFSSSKERMELSLFNGKVSKLQSIMNIIDNKYVDHIDIDSLNELVIPQVLKHLDPHSIYIPAKDLNQTEKEVVGHYYGVGITTMTFSDTATIVNIIPGGPAALQSELKVGDQILSVNGEDATGPVASNTVTDRISGDYGTSASLTIKRFGIDTLIHIDVPRGKVPVNSLTSSYMVDSTTSYFKLESFSDRTYYEFLHSVNDLWKDNKIRNLILDLRDNGGGRLEPARQLACLFTITGDTVFVMKKRDNEIERICIDTSSMRGLKLTAMRMACLVDYNTASAAEMVAAALQDNDRGIIVGRRTFGKGLVQTPTLMPDGSQVNITTERIYAPSGRTIQKPYDEYKTDNYSKRVANGEMDSAAAFKPTDTTKYYTFRDRTVYSKSGIMPDVFVPLAEWPQNKTSKMLLSSTTMIQYIVNRYVRHEGDEDDFIKSICDDEQATFDDFIAYAQLHNSNITLPKRKDKKELDECRAEICPIIKAYAYYVVGDMSSCEKYFNHNDMDIAAAANALHNDSIYATILRKIRNKK